MKSYTGCSHKIVLAFVLMLSVFSSQIAFATNCTGTGAGSCGGIGATSSTCANYYFSNGSSSIQCKWNSTYCGNGATCSSSQSKCTGTPAGSCSGIAKVTSSTCSNYYLNAGSSSIQCKWNGSYCSDGGVHCSA